MTDPTTPTPASGFDCNCGATAADHAAGYCYHQDPSNPNNTIPQASGDAEQRICRNCNKSTLGKVFCQHCGNQLPWEELAVAPPLAPGDAGESDGRLLEKVATAKAAGHFLTSGHNADVGRLIEIARRATQPPPQPAQTYQSRVQPWLLACFGEQISINKVERNHRFLEESLELVQSTGCTQSEAHQLVDYVFNREVGDPAQEIGGVMNTLAALCLAHGYDMHVAGEIELARVWTKVEQIRAKQAAKPKHSPLPQHVQPQPAQSADARVAELEADARRYRYLRDHRSYSYAQEYVEPSPAECGIEWHWQQSKPGDYADFDALIDTDIDSLAADEDDENAQEPRP